MGRYYLNKGGRSADRRPDQLNRSTPSATIDKILYSRPTRTLEYGKVIDAMDIAVQERRARRRLITDQRSGRVDGRRRPKERSARGPGGGDDMAGWWQSRRLTNEINVTPMIDVLLVLLIIFMITSRMSEGDRPAAPDPKPPGNRPTRSHRTRSCSRCCLVRSSASTRSRSRANALAQLKDIYDPRPDKIMFVKGDPKVKYQDVIWAMDVARGAGVKVIGIPPKDSGCALAP